MIFKKIFFVISIFIGLNLSCSYATPKVNQDTCEILLIGSSYFNYNNLSGLIKNLADSSNVEVYIEMHGQNGLFLSDHASSPTTEAKINERDWDYVVLQGVGILVAYPDYFTHHPVYPALQTLRDKILANNDSSRMVFCMPWAFEDGMTWYQDWPDTFEDMQIHIYNNTLQYSDEIGFEIAPVGWVWYAVLDEYDYPLHYLHMSDWSHPTLKGSYLMACTIYSAVFQETTVGNPYHAGISEEEVVFFQNVASDTVLNNLELWNITPLVTEIENITAPNNNYLYQNYPNPFYQSTTINYSLSNEQHIGIVVYDAFGRKVSVLVDEKQKPGEYYVEFDAAGYASGIYYYRMMTEKTSQSKIMILEKNK